MTGWPWTSPGCPCIVTYKLQIIRDLKIPRFRCTGTSKLPLLVLARRSRPLFTPEKRLGYRVARLCHYQIWREKKNMEKHGVLPIPVRRNRGINMAVVEVMFQRNPFEITGGQELMLSVVLHQLNFHPEHKADEIIAFNFRTRKDKSRLPFKRVKDQIMTYYGLSKQETRLFSWRDVSPGSHSYRHLIRYLSVPFLSRYFEKHYPRSWLVGLSIWGSNGQYRLYMYFSLVNWLFSNGLWGKRCRVVCRENDIGLFLFYHKAMQHIASLTVQKQVVVCQYPILITTSLHKINFRYLQIRKFLPKVLFLLVQRCCR